MGLYYNGKKVRNLYFNGKCITRLALGKEMTRLVEGDDFVRAEWLCGRNGAYIDTGHKLTTIEDAFTIHARYDKTLRNELNQEQEIFGFATGRGGDANNLFVRAYIYGSNGFNANYYWHKADSSDWGGADLGVNMDGEVTIELKADENNYYVNYDGVNVVKTPLLSLSEETYGNVYLFNLNDNMGKGHFNGDVAYFRITDPTFSIDRVNMIPCRLLRPIPATLDANGIARNAGECGMYDAVSGKFYGNVGSGTFTVSDN